MAYSEKSFQVEFGKNNTQEGVFELKITKSRSVRFDAVQPHQREALLNAQSDDGVYHKIADQTIGRGLNFGYTQPKPFDCFLIRNTRAYVVVMFYEPRKRKMVYYIEIKTWLALERIIPKKSITEALLVEDGIYHTSYLK